MSIFEIRLSHTTMNAAGAAVLTIGHSTHDGEAFVALLQRYAVTQVADVRSSPYSRFNPQFNREALTNRLAANGIEYAFLGKELGGRPDDASCYENGRVRYDFVSKTLPFQQGLERIRSMAGRRIALMCSEKEPLECHRARRIVDVRLNNSSQLSGFAKQNDLAYFLNELCGMEYAHLPQLAPTQEILSDYRKKRIDWETYESRFMELMRERRIEETIPEAVIQDGCLLCSEDQPHHCHRRLVAEYLEQEWGELDIVHIGQPAKTRVQ